MINQILSPVLMFLGMAMPAILLLLLQLSGTLVRADQQTDMFFTGTVMTDATSVVLTDPESGEVLVANDGC